MICTNKNFWEHDKLIKIDRIKPLNVLKKYKDDVISRARDLLERNFLWSSFLFYKIRAIEAFGDKEGGDDNTPGDY
jgi:hypothetical protein